MKQGLKEVGLKLTNPRIKILNVLEKAEYHHLSAEDIYKILLAQNDEVALATIYRVLTQFHNAGVVTRHNFEGGYSVFELNQGSHHDHLVCVKCGKIVEFVDDLIEERQKQIAQKAGFIISEHSLNIYGTCKECH